MVRAVWAAFAASVLISGPAQAQSAVGSDTPALVEARSQLSAAGRVSWYRGEYDACTEKPSTVEIVACIDDLTKAWDRRLNAAYGALMDGQTPEQKVRLHGADADHDIRTRPVDPPAGPARPRGVALAVARLSELL
ncbi:MAG: hypothetical protein B7Z30_12115 [Rhizobiales bacterium 12-68-15]|nr:MAG: hypothetical protein B7Z30_12115 [Rhizobiales bacterium 12-68-15]